MIRYWCSGRGKIRHELTPGLSLIVPLHLPCAFYLILHPLLPGEKGCKSLVIMTLSPSPPGEGFRVR
jgi:hypothetical protein